MSGLVVPGADPDDEIVVTVTGKAKDFLGITTDFDLWRFTLTFSRSVDFSVRHTMRAPSEVKK